MGCACIGVEFGTYANQEAVTTPDGKTVGIDRCVLNDVSNLWDIGLSTIESCCGHGKAPGYIAVSPDQHQQMLDLGWLPDPRVNRAGIFQWPRLP